MKKSLLIYTLVFISLTTYSQGIDSTQIGGDYPYALPFLGQKSFERGYKLPLPHGVMANSIYTKQNIVLENFEMGFSTTDGSGLGLYHVKDILRKNRGSIHCNPESVTGAEFIIRLRGIA